MYNPDIHNRRSIRLKGYDYSQDGLYYVTICVSNRAFMFGDIVDGRMVLNEFGVIAENAWNDLETRFHMVKFDVFQIMPNHIHVIIGIVGATLAVAQNVATLAVAQNVIHAKNMAYPKRAGASPAPDME